MYVCMYVCVRDKLEQSAHAVKNVEWVGEGMCLCRHVCACMCVCEYVHKCIHVYILMTVCDFPYF